MAEQDFNQPVAEAIIPVKADMDEFRRVIDDELAALTARFDEAADAAAKGFADKVGAALDAISLKLGEIIEKAGGLQLPTPTADTPRREDEGTVQQGGADLSEVVGKIEDATDELRVIRDTVITIQSQVGHGGGG